MYLYLGLAVKPVHLKRLVDSKISKLVCIVASLSLNINRGGCHSDNPHVPACT